MTQPNIAFVFPGQGSQKVGMLADIAKQHETLLETFDRASEQLGYDLWDLSQYGSQEEISRTEITQPLLLTASVALWRLWQDLEGATPTAMAGHSLGEWSALVCADVVDFPDALGLVQKRAKYMQSAVPPGEGAMTAIVGLEDDKIREACDSVSNGSVVTPVNFNAPGQVVIAGEAEAVARAGEACKEAGAKRALPLPVSGPFHTSLMQPAAEMLARDIASVEFSSPKIPIIHNVTLSSEQDPATIKELMIRQITGPVPWVSTIEKLAEMGVQTLVECGPGRVLSGLNRRISRDLDNQATDTLDTLQAAVTATR
jgi:[acyl-carrier-protein] S-malonyltransferase